MNEYNKCILIASPSASRLACHYFAIYSSFNASLKNYYLLLENAVRKYEKIQIRSRRIPLFPTKFFRSLFQISFKGSPNRKDTPAVSVRGKFYTYATFYGVRFIVKDIEVPKKC